MAQAYPKVSGVLPVGYGDRFFRVAMTAFLSQDYPGELELVIVDNSDEPIQALLLEDDRIKYIRSERKPVGALRNIGTEQATGEIIVSIDEDDWSGPNRISTQVNRLVLTGKSVTGFHDLFYYDTSDCKTYRYFYEPNKRPHEPYACGSSQMYLKAWWTRHRFPSTGIEDYQFGKEALHANQLDSISGDDYLVARAHGASVCPATQLGRHRQFPAVPKEDLPAAFFAAIAPPSAKAKPKSKLKVQEQ